MANYVDIVDIKSNINNGELKVYLNNGTVYMSNDIGETIALLNVKKCTRNNNPRCTHYDRKSGLCKAEKECV